MTCSRSHSFSSAAVDSTAGLRSPGTALIHRAHCLSRPLPVAEVILAVSPLWGVQTQWDCKEAQIIFF